MANMIAHVPSTRTQSALLGACVMRCLSLQSCISASLLLATQKVKEAEKDAKMKHVWVRVCARPRTGILKSFQHIQGTENDMHY